MSFLRLRRLLKSAGSQGLVLLWALRDAATPRALKLGVLALLAYVISPVDLIPDLPLLGWLDDAAIVMFAVPWLFRRLPLAVRARAEQAIGRFAQAARFGTR